jgi:hypothetical protein
MGIALFVLLLDIFHYPGVWYVVSIPESEYTSYGHAKSFYPIGLNFSENTGEACG